MSYNTRYALVGSIAIGTLFLFILSIFVLGLSLGIIIDQSEPLFDAPYEEQAHPEIDFFDGPRQFEPPPENEPTLEVPDLPEERVPFYEYLRQQGYLSA